jgi:hypothetical protein
VNGIDGDPAAGVPIIWYARLGGDFAELFRNQTDNSGEASIPNGPEGRLFFFSMGRFGAGLFDVGGETDSRDALRVSLREVDMGELRVWDADSRAPIEATNVTLLDSKGRRGPVLRLLDSDGRYVFGLPQGFTGAEIRTVAYRAQRVESLKANDRRDVPLQPE